MSYKDNIGPKKASMLWHGPEGKVDIIVFAWRCVVLLYTWNVWLRIEEALRGLVVLL